jgi:hypothetical protein
VHRRGKTLKNAMEETTGFKLSFSFSFDPEDSEVF